MPGPEFNPRDDEPIDREEYERWMQHGCPNSDNSKGGNEMETVAGVDVGLTGGIAILGQNIEITEEMPVMPRGLTKKVRVKNQVNPAELARILRPHKIVCAYVERVSTMAKQGIASNGSLMHSLGVVEGVLAALGIPTVMVNPKDWKGHFSLLKAEKDASRMIAQRLFPKVSLARKCDSGVAEGLLIARYGQSLRKNSERPEYVLDN